MRDSPMNRARFADTLRVALSAFLTDKLFRAAPELHHGHRAIGQGTMTMVWPNPAEDLVQVEVRSRAAGDAVRIIDACGQTQRYGTTGTPVDVRSLPAGPISPR
ncbi:MAG: T9SS type A sorting domain-containing protein [Flavobacteriales bacterium]|nr:T9SS type A sorting domain-containing protein [Flavobacteriales bacterium]